MATAIWQLEVAGVVKSLTDWNIRNAVVNKRSFAADEFTFSIPVADIYANPGFAYGQLIRLQRDDVYWFVGNVVFVASNFGGDTERVGVTVANAWRKLERIIYQQKYVYKTGDDFSVLNMDFSTRVTLGQDAWGVKISTDQQISNIMVYALTQSSGVPVLSSISTMVTPPLSEARDISCAAAIMRMVEYTPDCASWFDYSTGVGIMFITRRSFLTGVTLNLANANQITSVQGLRARPDMVPAGVLFTFITGALDPTTSQLVPGETRQSAGLTSGEGVVCATVQLANQGTPTAETVPFGLASEYYASLIFPSYEGSLTIHEQECSGLLRPGNLLNLSGGRAEWAAMLAMVNNVSEDLDRGITNVDCGLPTVMGAQDFLDLMTRWRNLKPVTDFQDKQTNGTAGVDGAHGGDGPKPAVTPVPNPKAGQPSGGMMSGSSFQAEFCESGQTVTKTVLGA